MALGYRDRAPDETGTEWLWSGTSFSAPTITGAVALMAQAFPNLTGSRSPTSCFRAPTISGRAAPIQSTVTARLNIARAFQPIGPTSLAGSQTAVSTLLERRHAAGLPATR